jgi:hypothetical protein
MAGAMANGVPLTGDTYEGGPELLHRCRSRFPLSLTAHSEAL